MPPYNQNFVFSGLGTLSTQVPTAGLYLLRGQISLPTLVGGSGVSSCLVTINQNGSPVYTGQAGAEGFQAEIQCSALDTLAVVLSSAASADQPSNVIKMNAQLSLGG